MFPFDYLFDVIQRMRTFCINVKDNFKDALVRKKFVLSERELENYECLTFLTVEQIRRVYYMFELLGAEFTQENKNPILDIEPVLNSPELRMNPFKDRIVKIFTDSDDDCITFEEFLNMMSVFSEEAPLKIKADYAFKIYDFNGDNLLCPEDISEMINRLKGNNPLKDWVYEMSEEIIMAEMDVDGDGFINFSEFEHKLSKNPTFLHSFKMRI